MDRSPTPSAGNAARFAFEADNIFARIAGRYDRLCDLFSLGIHRLWKRHMAARMARDATGVVLDLASGTGDIPLRLLRRLKGSGDITLWVTDLCPEMLALARKKLAGAHGDLRFVEADAHGLTGFADGSVDFCSISFGMKICDRACVMAEVMRVLKPGGRFFCLEAAAMRPRWLHRLYLGYMDWCLPLIGRIASSGDASTYAYLLRGVHEFPPQAAFADELKAAGFAEITWRNLSLGIVALHLARKPAAA